jgi:hypothetical protein
MKLIKVIFKVLAAVIAIGLIALAVMAIMRRKDKDTPAEPKPATD